MIQEILHSHKWVGRDYINVMTVNEDGTRRRIALPNSEFIAFLNNREAALKAKTAPSVFQKTIAVDFDGTLCDHKFPAIGAPKPFAKDALRLFRKLGYRVVIWTCRTCHWNYDVFGGDPTTPTLERPHVKEMIQWLNEQGIEYDEIDDGSRGKPLADFYIDDKAIRLDGTTNWADIMAAIAILHTPSASIPTKEKDAE